MADDPNGDNALTFADIVAIGFKAAENLPDSWMPRGVKSMGPITLNLQWRDDPREICRAQPCPSCLICGECKDFHGFGTGCTDATCPLLRPNLPDDWPIDDEG